VRFFSTDLASNAESPQSQAIQLNPYKTVVALTFDDAYESFYTDLRPMLRAHNMNATIYTITSDVASPFPCCMSYAQLRTMQREGDDIGGHGRDHLDLTDPSTTYDQKVADVCNSRQDLLDHGIFDPASYAYPFGKVNATAEAIVQSCGYQTSRQGGALASTTTTPGPRYADTLPPGDAYNLRTIDVDAPNPKTLSDMQNFVSAASSHGGGLLVLTFHEVCNQSDANFSSCMSTWSPVDTSVLGPFIGNAGQQGGAPAGVSVQTVRDAINTPDSTPPTSNALCDGAPCQASPYGGSVRVSLSASDPGGSGVKRIFYTTDGSTPTASSAVYDTPLIFLKSTTVKFFAVDNAGNAEQVNTADVQVGANPDPVVAAAGDIACDPADPSFNNGRGTADECHQAATSALLVRARLAAVLPLGDLQYECGAVAAFQRSYEPTWGRVKSLSRPVIGNHEYQTWGGDGCSAQGAPGYFGYFAAAAGDRSRGYYSFDLGAWHLIALNSNCHEIGGCGAGSPQERWLRADLGASRSRCTLAYMHHPRFSSGKEHGDDPALIPLWKALYDGGADMVLVGHEHNYERFAPLTAFGTVDRARGLREFVVGTGGRSHTGFRTPVAGSERRNDATFGVLELTLRPSGYSWQFVPEAGKLFTDTGSASCH
jgi:peptidoglycan/xylan/chitin deacetylase (PgdA/CDA1 family)